MAVLVPVVVLVVTAAVVLVLLARGEEPAPPPPAGAVRVPLLTGPPLSGAGAAALTFGRLGTDVRGCAVLRSTGRRGLGTVEVAWPSGWTALEVDGRLELRDQTGELRARQGDWVEAGGGSVGSRPSPEGPCAPRGRGVFLVQSEPEVVAPTPIDLLTDGARPGTGPSRVLTGTLGLTRGCLTLRRGDGRQLTVWPDGWTAGTDPDGVSVVRDSEGVVRATTGGPVRVTGTRRGTFAYTGAYDPIPRLDPAACGSGAIFVRGVAELP